MSGSKQKSKKLGEILKEVGLITAEQLEEALQEQKESGNRLGDVLVELGFVTEKDIVHAYSVQLGIPCEHPETAEIPPAVLDIISEDLAERHAILPVKADETSVTVVMADPLSLDISDSIAFATGKKVKVAVATPTEIRKAIQKFYWGSNPNKLGEILVTAGLITEEQLDLVLREKEKTKKRFGEICIEEGYVSERDIVQALSMQLGIPYTDLETAEPEQNALEAIPENLASRHLILPLSTDERRITVVMVNPLDIKAVNAINFATGKEVKVTVSTHSKIKKAIRKYYNDVKPRKLGNILSDAPFVDPREYTQSLRDANKKLGQILTDAGLISEENLSLCLEMQKESRRRLGKIIVECGYVKETDIIRAISEQMKIPYADLTSVTPDKQAFKALPAGFAKRHLVLPLNLEKKIITVVMANPLDKKTINEVALSTSREVRVAIASPVEIWKAIQEYYHETAPKKLGELLIDAGLITADFLSTCLEIQKKSKKKLGEILVEQGYVREEGIAQAFSEQLRIPYTDLVAAEPESRALKLIPQSIANRHIFIPLSVDKRTLTIAMADPLDVDALNEIREITGKNVKATVSTATQIKNMIVQRYQFSDDLMDIAGKVEVIDTQKVEVFHTTDDTIKKTESQPIIRTVNNMITQAVKEKASDIHLEAGPSSLVVRNRVDGLLRVVNYLPKWVMWPVISRLKIMAKMDIAERRMPQDGRIKVKVENKEVDLRVSTLPSQYGENVVIRLLDVTSAVLNLKDMGLSKTDYTRLKGIIERPQGLVLVTGPTGSGKSSTMYAMLNHIKDTTKNIITLEDPIEYELNGVNQVGISERLSFAQALRAVLRQDPDVILIGEMRDSETAHIAVQASITGHLVISTLHTNTAAAAINRLRYLGLKPFMIASCLNGVIAQRLARKICADCSQPYIPSEDDFVKLGLSLGEGNAGMKAFRGKGCNACSNTGYKGRLGVFEILPIDPNIRNLIMAEAPEDQIVHEAHKAGMKYMIDDGIEKLNEGIISFPELSRVISTEKKIWETKPLLCRKCGEHVKDDFVICPFCGDPLLSRCAACKREIDPEWKYCPYCSQEVSSQGEGDADSGASNVFRPKSA